MKRGEGKLLYYRTEDGKTELQIKGKITETIAEIGQLDHLIHIRISKNDLFSGIEFERIMRDPTFWDEVFKTRPEDQIISEMNTRPKKEGDKT
jgi:hypothetical protein